MDPFRHSDAYFTCRMNGIEVPGETILSGALMSTKFDETAGTGTSGAGLKHVGDELSPLTMEVRLWLPSHFDAFESKIRPIIRRPPVGQTPSPIDIEHPELQKLDLRRFVVTKIYQLERVETSGIFAYKIDFKQHSPPKAIGVGNVTGKQDANDGEGGAKEKPTDPQDAAIEKLTAKLEEQSRLNREDYAKLTGPP
jgi:hypothetical protein